MKVLVPTKRVPDPDAKIVLRADGAGVDLTGMKHAINPFDAVALEEAIRLRENGQVTEVCVVSVGEAECAEQLRTALAMGADRAIHVDAAGELDSLTIARLLAAVCAAEKPELILMGKQAIDGDSGQVGPMLAGLLNVGQVSFISKVQIEEASVRCDRETDRGVETLVVRLPAVLTADLRLNEPRYVSMPGLIRAKKKTIESLNPAKLGITVEYHHVKVVKLELPAGRKRGVMLSSADEFVARLREELKSR